MEQEATEPKRGVSCLARIIWLVLILLGLYFLLQAIGLDPVWEREREEIIDRPHD